MKILVIGGSVFLGRAIVEAALAAGHEVTTFNRGVSRPDPAGVEAVHGDREVSADLARLVEGRHWDGVIDVCGFVPAVVLESVRALNGHAAHYTFISSISAYPDMATTPGVDETFPTYECPPDATEGEYGALKAGCERAVEQFFEGGTLIIDPGLILGPHENVGRMPWWLTRLERGGKVLAPGDPDLPIQLIDARDIAEFTVAKVGVTGRFFVGGVPGNATYGSWLADMIEVTGSDAELVWVDDAFLVEHDVKEWIELPLWLVRGPESAGMWLSSSRRALDAGLRVRPVAETVRDTWEWLREIPVGERQFGARIGDHGIDPDKEARILAAWAERNGG